MRTAVVVTDEEVPVRPSVCPSISVAELATCAGVPLCHATDRMVSGVALRTRDVQPGDLYVTPPRPSTQGADVVEVALAAGAVAVLTDCPGMAHAAMQVAGAAVLRHPRLGEVLGQIAARIYGDPTAELVVLGVTGTSGKTTTSYLVEAGLRAAGLTTGLVGTLGARVGGQALAGQRLTGQPATMPEAPDQVVNVDDPWGARLVRPDTVTVSLREPTATWHASGITPHSDGGQRFTAHGPDGVGASVQITLPGQFNAANALLALACLHAVGVSPQQAAAGLAATAVPGRTERVDAGGVP